MRSFLSSLVLLIAFAGYTHAANNNLGCNCRSDASYHPNGMLNSCILLEDKVIQGNNFPAHSTVYFRSDGTLEAAYISKEMVIQGFLCSDQVDNTTRFNFITFAPNGKLSSFTSKKSVQFFKMEFPEKTYCAIDGEGNLAHCNIWTPMTIQGIDLPAKTHIGFYPSGKIRNLSNFTTTLKIKEFTCKTNADISVNFYENGIIESCCLAENAKVDQSYPAMANQWVYFFESGSLRRFYLAEPTKVLEYPCNLGSVEFFSSGKLKSFYLNESVKYASFTLAKGYTEFFENGNLSKATFSENTMVQDCLCIGSVEFFENGNLAKCTLADISKVGGLPCYKYVHFYENGKPKQSVIGKTCKKPSPYSGTFAKDYVIKWNSDGTLRLN